MTTLSDRTTRVRAFTDLVDRAIRITDHEERYVSVRKAAAFQHILEEIARLSPEAIDLIEECFAPFYQRRIDDASELELVRQRRLDLAEEAAE